MQQKSKFLKSIVHVLDQVEVVRSHDAVDRGNADGLLHLPDGRQVLRISGITPLAPLSPLCMILYILYCIDPACIKGNTGKHTNFKSKRLLDES